MSGRRQLTADHLSLIADLRSKGYTLREIKHLLLMIAGASVSERTIQRALKKVSKT